MTRRRGRWTYKPGTGWLLDGTELVLDYDPLNAGGDLRGCYLLDGEHDGCRHDAEPVDHFVDGAMEWVEQHVDRQGGGP